MATDYVLGRDSMYTHLPSKASTMTETDKAVAAENPAHQAEAPGATTKSEDVNDESVVRFSP